jgi:hypothetical protein
MPVIKPGDFDDDRVKALLTRHLEGMHANSPPGHVFALDSDRQLYARTKSDLARREWMFVQNYADAKTAVIDGILARARRDRS